MNQDSPRMSPSSKKNEWVIYFTFEYTILSYLLVEIFTKGILKKGNSIHLNKRKIFKALLCTQIRILTSSYLCMEYNTVLMIVRWSLVHPNYSSLTNK